MQPSTQQKAMAELERRRRMGGYDTTTARVVRVEVFLPDNGRADSQPTTGVKIYQAKDLTDVGYTAGS